MREKVKVFPIIVLLACCLFGCGLIDSAVKSYQDAKDDPSISHVMSKVYSAGEVGALGLSALLGVILIMLRKKKKG